MAAELVRASGAGPQEQFGEFVASFFDDPLGFACSCYRWGDPAVGLEGVDGPDVWQRAWLDKLGRMLRAGVPVRKATSAGHGVGKGAITSMTSQWLMSTRPHLAGVITANTGAQLKSKTWRELSIWHKRLLPPLEAMFQWTSRRFFHKAHPETWGLDAIPWNERKPEAFAGLHSRDVVVIYDEASAIPDGIWEVTEGAMTTLGAMWFVFGNPTRNTGRFHRCFHRDRHRWVRWCVDGRLARWTDKAQLGRWIEDHGEDSDFVRVRVRGLFPRAASVQLIGHDAVEAATVRGLVEDEGAALVLSLDIARFGDDQSVLGFRQGWDARSRPWAKYRGLDGIQLAGHVAEAAHKHRPDCIVLDGGGVGASVVDQLKALNVRFVTFDGGTPAREPKQFINKRAECWAAMRDWLGEQGCIPDDPELADDLVGPFYAWDRHGRLQLEAKADMKKRGLASPDHGDMLAMTFAPRVPRRDSPNARRGGGRGAEAEVAFN